jgi:hypothetical protein
MPSYDSTSVKQDIEKIERSLKTLEYNLYGYGTPGYNMNKYKIGSSRYKEAKVKFDKAFPEYQKKKSELEKQLSSFNTKLAEAERQEKADKKEKEDKKKLDEEKKKVAEAKEEIQRAKDLQDKAAQEAAEKKLAEARIKRNEAEKVITDTKQPPVITNQPSGYQNPTQSSAQATTIDDFLKSAIGNVEKTKKLQQALKDAGTYNGPVNGIFNAEALLPAAIAAEEDLDKYASLGLVYTDRFEFYKTLANNRKAATEGGLGSEGPTTTQYPSISSPTAAVAKINEVFNAELGRDATPSEIKIFSAKLIDAERKQPSTQTIKIVKGKKIVETLTGVNANQFLIDEINKNSNLKKEIDQRLEGAKSITRQELEKTAIANGLDLDDNFGSIVNDWIKRVDNGEDVDIFKNLIRGTAKIGLPDKVAQMVDNGLDLDIIYSPYKKLMAATLEIDPTSISLNDPTLRMAIGPDKEMPIYEYQRSLRKDPRWQFTDKAREEVASTASRVLKDFGFQG